MTVDGSIKDVNTDSPPPPVPPIEPVRSHLHPVSPRATTILILLTVVASIVIDTASDDGRSFFGLWGMKTIAGQWWRLVTVMFVHHFIWHLLVNMVFLWLFGRYLERFFGRWTLIAFYFSCGVAGAIASLTSNPEIRANGASGAVFGVAAGLLTAYLMRIRILAKRQWIVLSVLVVWVPFEIYAGRFEEVDNAGHVGGLLAGLSLGFALNSSLGQTVQNRKRIFVAFALLLVIWMGVIRERNVYVVHLNDAYHALEHHQPTQAAKELHIALRMNPDSKLGHDLVRQLEDQEPRRDECSSLRKSFDSFRDPCDVLKCDGLVHTFQLGDGTGASYQGTKHASPSASVSGVLQNTTSSNVVAQTLDEFGEIACTTRWDITLTQKLGPSGNVIGILSGTAREEGVFEYDPTAQHLRDRTIHSQAK